MEVLAVSISKSKGKIKSLHRFTISMKPLNFSGVCATIFTKCKMSVAFAAETMDESL